MAEQRGLGVRCSPMRQHAAQVNGPLMSGHDLDLAYQVQRAAFYEKRTVKTYTWPNATTAPLIYNSTTVNSDITFKHDQRGLSPNPDIVIPWLAHPNATGLGAVMYVATQASDLEFRVSIETSTMTGVAGAVTTTQGDRSPISVPKIMPRVAMWARTYNEFPLSPWSFSIAKCSVEPDYPSDRKDPFQVKIYGYWHASAVTSDAEPERSAAIMTLRLFDIIDGPDPEA